MDEHLERNLRASGVEADLIDGELARHDHAREAERSKQPDRERRRRGHLRRCVDLQVLADRLREERDRGILDDDRIDPSGGDPAEQLLDDGQLGLEHERVHGDVEASAGAVDPRDDLGEPVAREVHGTGACVEPVIETEINRVRACGEGGRERVAVTSGSQDLGAAHSGATFLGSVPYHVRSGNPSIRRTLGACSPLALRIPTSL